MASNLDPSILNNNNERFETGSSRTGYNNGKQSLQASNLKEIIFLKKKQHDLDVRSTLPANCYRGCLERCLRFENTHSVTENSLFV